MAKWQEMRKKYLILLILFPSLCFSQPTISKIYHGTFTLAALCKNGIILISDSRSSFDDINDYSIGAYFEKSLKLYSCGNIGMSYAGITSYTSNLNFHGLFKNFCKAKHTDLSFITFINAFLNYAKKVYSWSDFDTLNLGIFFYGGYINGVSQIGYHHYNDSLFTLKAGNYFRNIPMGKYENNFNGILSKMDLKEATIFLKDRVSKFIESLQKTGHLGVGGKLSIININKDGLVWIDKEDGNVYYTEKDFKDAFINGKVHMWYKNRLDSVSLRKAFLAPKLR